MLTFAHPEPGVRLLVLDSSKQDWKVRAGEMVASFWGQMQTMISDYQQVVETLVANWPTVMEEARQHTKELFRPEFYPTASDVRQRLYVNFAPVASEMSADVSANSMLANAYAASQLETARLAVQRELTGSAAALEASLAHFYKKLVIIRNVQRGKSDIPDKNNKLFETDITNILDATARIRWLAEMLGRNEEAEVIKYCKRMTFGIKSMPGKDPKAKLKLCRANGETVKNLKERVRNYVKPCKIGGCLRD